MAKNEAEKITIVLPVFRPRLDWLAEQLESLERQTYQSLALLIVDDCPDDPVGEAFFEAHLRRIPYQYYIHAETKGSDISFAELVRRARGDYIAFCDQDDRWRPQKLERLLEALQASKASAVYCGLSAIDAEGKRIARDIREVRRRNVFLSGSGIAPELLLRNCIYGCSLLLPAKVAKDALPLPEGMGYDHWFTLWAAMCGPVLYLDEHLVEHRLHGNNQSQPLRGIRTREDYIVRRIIALRERMASSIPRFRQSREEYPSACGMEKLAGQTLAWAQARERWARRDLRAWKTFFAFRNLSLYAFLFELPMPFLPAKAVEWLLKRFTS